MYNVFKLYSTFSGISTIFKAVKSRKSRHVGESFNDDLIFLAWFQLRKTQPTCLPWTWHVWHVWKPVFSFWWIYQCFIMFLRSPHRHPFIFFLHFACAINWEDTCGGTSFQQFPTLFEKGNSIPRSHIRPPQQRWSLATWASGICSPGFSTDSNLELGWNPEALKKALGLKCLRYPEAHWITEDSKIWKIPRNKSLHLVISRNFNRLLLTHSTSDYSNVVQQLFPENLLLP